MSNSLDEEKIISKLRGNTLRAYWAFLNSEGGVIGVRQLQRELGFSSPALAAYHLNRLEELGLIAKEHGDYRLVREVRVGVLRQFVKLGTFMLPRYVLYASMFTALLVFLVTQLKEFNFYSLYALALGILATAVLWYETLRVWRLRP